MDRRTRRSPPRCGLALLCLLAASWAISPAAAAWLRPLSGEGHFRFTCDLVNLTRPEGSCDVVALVAVPHRELVFQTEAGAVRARVRAYASLRGLQGQEVTAESSLRLTARNASEAGSPLLQQIFTLTLRGVDFQVGEFELVLEDLQRRRPGLSRFTSQEPAFARLLAAWYAPPAREAAGLAVGAAVFLAHAPIRLWEGSGRGSPAAGPWDYVNPARRYGLEADALQVYFNLEAPDAAAAERQRAAGSDLRLEITNDRLDYTLVDTLRLTPTVRDALRAGRSAAVYWEMDAGGLPPGSYRFGIAPLDTVGRALLTSFDVIWRLDQLARDPSLLLAEGRIVLQGAARRDFEDATNAEREVMLAAFWKDLDPTPDDPYNELLLEFQRRIAYVQVFLGGFDGKGPRDPRADVYLLLGEPSSIFEEPVPMSHRELEDARILVYERYGAERPGTVSRSLIPMPYSYLGEVNIRSKKTTADSRVFQLWRYDHSGEQLFPNRYSGLTGGLRFLFVDRTGLGDFVLDATNTTLMGD